MRIVLDTNALVSGMLNPTGNPGRVLDGIVLGEIVVVVDDRIVAEYREVIARPKFAFDEQQRARVLAFLLATGERVVAPPIAASLPDPGDVPFLEVAKYSGVEALVTGNTRHFPQESRGGVVVLTPAEFVAAWRAARALQEP